MKFMLWVHPAHKLVEICPFGPDLQTLDNVYKSVMYSSPDAMVRFAFGARVHNIVANIRYSPVLAYAEILCDSKVDWLL